MSAQVDCVESLIQAFDSFYEMLDAATVPSADGGRKVGGIAHAVALSEVTDVLYRELAAAHTMLCQQHGAPLSAVPPSMTLMESDSPDGPWTKVPQESMRVHAYPIGGKGADAALLAALENATTVVAFPTAKWNAMQARKPGASHQRWHAGEMVTAKDLAVLESAAKLLRLAATRRNGPRTKQLTHAEQIRRLAQAFCDLQGRPHAEPLSVSRVSDTDAVSLPANAEFCALAAGAGRLLADLPEHWRFGVQARTMSEADPAKRWAGVLFDFAIGGLLDVPNWDESKRAEHIDDAARASALACDVLLRFSSRPNWGKGNYAAAMEMARADADDLLARARPESDSQAVILYACSSAALSAACAIAKMSRGPAVISPSQFVHDQTHLNEFLERADKVVKETDVLRDWPTTPGTTFSWMGGDSAIQVALEFSRAVLSATLCTRMETVGVLGHNPPNLRIADPDLDPKITAWRDATVKELQDHTLPSAPAWPMWEILRDERKMGSLLRDEYSRALKARTEPARGREVEPAYLDALAIMSRVSPAEVNDVEMPLPVPEVEVRRTFERLLGERYHAKDSSVESCDLFTLQGTHKGRHCRVAAMFKGPGIKKWPLQIAGCGKNGNQVVKLFGVPADVYIVQANGAFDPHLLRHVQHTADAHAMRDGHVVPYILIDGTTTARILRAEQQKGEQDKGPGQKRCQG